ncbi:WD40 repeat-like protein [Gloeophyllum trabeum ATCC 11539]|uniref:WD40 repeat-like protein n=1 Tax=Gloeophyllum trabeum (strain ATCC 11539 / FP-39264 / Madison 617) TaxID=670483 RepID=S7S0P4_GLOTA|nr:WD40 repeat-like protein [Gloeophyllum trabeum ATCC 11539]EPQ60935.1 WD40 repeat-like protein [Gloeophyllum trabeum ATCC 11539]
MADTTTLSVHRCRFVDYTPSAITALAFPPLPLPSVKGKKPEAPRKALKVGTLAVGRANGNVELCEWTGTENQIEAPQAWVVRKTLSGPYPSKVDNLAFVIRYPDLVMQDEVPTVEDLRLFSTGGGTELVEWDLEKGCVKRTIPSHGGSIWCIAPNHASTLLALGCEDGSVRILSLADDSIVHHRRFDRAKSRLLSIAWGPPVPKQKAAGAQQASEDSDEDEDTSEDWIDSWIVTGGSDSSLRKWDVATGRVVDRMGTDKLRGERTLVWSVAVLGDGTIISGDSMGMVKMWESRTCTQLQSFQGHGADVLCLAIGPEGTTVYSSGVDQKITQFSLVKTGNPSDKSSILRSNSRWVQSTSRRMHSHDVRALAMWPPYSPLPPTYKRIFPIDIAPILASGGLDMSVVLTPAAVPTSTITKIINPLSTSTVATFEDSYHRRLAYSSGHANTSGLKLTKQAGLLMCMHDDSLSLWRILKKRTPPLGDDADAVDADLDTSTGSGGWSKVLEMDLSVQSNLVASSMSDDGRWVVVSDLFETKLFALEQASKDDQLKPRRIREFPSILQGHLPKSRNEEPSTGASAFAFSPDSSKLAMATTMSGYVLIVDLGSGEAKPRVLRRFDHHRMQRVPVRSRFADGPQANGDGDDIEMDEEPASDGDDEASLAEESSPVTATVSRMAVSVDGQWLATTDDRCRTHIFNLDSVQHHCVLPTFPQPVHALAFSPSNPSILVLALANNTLHIFDVEARQFPDWARPLCASLPQRFTRLHDPVVGVTFDPGASARDPSGAAALFWGATWICKVKLDAPVGWGGFSKKRRRQSAKHDGGRVTSDEGRHDLQQTNFKLITHYRPLLLVDFLAPGELVVVERPLVDVLTKLPPAYFKPKYGAT